MLQWESYVFVELKDYKGTSVLEEILKDLRVLGFNRQRSADGKICAAIVGKTLLIVIGPATMYHNLILDLGLNELKEILKLKYVDTSWKGGSFFIIKKQDIEMFGRSGTLGSSIYDCVAEVAKVEMQQRVSSILTKLGMTP